MNFKREKIRDFYILDTKVENIFINEYLPTAPGDFVKVYMFALLYAEFEMPMSNEMMAKQLGLAEDKVLKAWAYWEEMGAVKRHYVEGSGNFDFSIEFINLKELLYGKTTSKEKEEAELISSKNELFDNNKTKEMFNSIEKIMNRTLSSTEIESFVRWIMDYSVPSDMIVFVVNYCIAKNKNSVKYMESVLRNWVESGCKTVDAVQIHLDEIDQRYYRYKRVFKALGFTRNATEAEEKIMDSWFDEYGFNMDRILEACSKTSGIANPSINYINKVLINWSTDAKKQGNDVNKKVTVTQGTLNEYYNYLRDKAEKEAEERKEEIYTKLPFIQQIDDDIKKMSSQLSKTLILGTGNNEEGKNLKKAVDKLAADRAVALTENNYPMDYTDIKYACERCSDTGTTDVGEKCSCIKQRMEEAEVWQKKR